MNGLPVRQVFDGLYVAPQLDAGAMPVAAAMGFKSVINNRPDFEHGPGQPAHHDIQAAAVAAGLEYRFLPVDAAHQSPQQIAAFARLMDELPSPVLAFCRSGTRSARLAMLALAQR